MKLRPDCSYSISKKSVLFNVCEPAPRASTGGAIRICRPPLKFLQHRVSGGGTQGSSLSASSLDAFSIRLEVEAGDSSLSPLHLPRPYTLRNIPLPHTHTHTHTHMSAHTPLLCSPNTSSSAKQIQGFCLSIFIRWSFNKISK